MSYPQLRLDAQLCFPLYAASRTVTRVYGEVLGELGLTYPQYLVLLALWEREDAMAIGDLGQVLKLDSGTLSPLVKRLESAGLVARRRDQADERRVLVELTADGRALESRAAHVPGRLRAAMDVTPFDAEALIEQLNTLIASLESGLAARGQA